MKRILPCLALLSLVFLATPAGATIRVLDNNGGNAAHYATWAEVYDASSIGDTVYVVGSATDYGSMTIAKPLTIIGPGYYLSENPGFQASPLSAQMHLVLDVGSDGSKIVGIQLTGGQSIIYADNITIQRCYNSYNGTAGAIGIENASNIIIKQCYFSVRPSLGTGINIMGTTTNVIVSNCYLLGELRSISMANTSGGVALDHCVMTNTPTLYNATVTNSILTKGVSSGSGNYYYNNLCSADQFPDENGNQLYVDMSTVFVGVGSFDGKWQLATGSPAIGAGTDGSDCGMFGGDDPYVLSGVPPVPTISMFYAPASGSPGAGLKVQMTVKARN